MARKQDRIEGSYTIVSTDGPNWARGEYTMAAVRMAWAAGCSVAVAVGVWDSVTEESLIITGPGHAAVGERIALEFLQEAYIVVGDGRATLMGDNGPGEDPTGGPGTHTYSPLTVWTRAVDRTTQRGYTRLPGGRELAFVR
jgi:hypothetical protein